MSDLVVVENSAPPAKAGLFDLGPAQMVQAAAEVANVLKDVIKKQGLASNIGGKEYVKVEGWSTLGCFLGILPREREVRELEDGSYEAVVELYNLKTGQVVGQGSALCSVDEKRWRGADKYARRSMAITRATGKAYRLGFSWIMTLSGYEATPAEEMPDPPSDSKDQKQKAPPPPRKEVEGTIEGAVTAAAHAYDNLSPQMNGRLCELLKELGIEERYWPKVELEMTRRRLALTKAAVALTAKEVAANG